MVIPFLVGYGLWCVGAGLSVAVYETMFAKPNIGPRIINEVVTNVIAVESSKISFDELIIPTGNVDFIEDVDTTTTYFPCFPITQHPEYRHYIYQVYNKVIPEGGFLVNFMNLDLFGFGIKMAIFEIIKVIPYFRINTPKALGYAIRNLILKCGLFYITGSSLPCILIGLGGFIIKKLSQEYTQNNIYQLIDI